MKEAKPLVIGLGNEFRGDDAIGIFVVRKLQKEYPAKAEYLIEQNDLTRILDKWQNRQVIIIDAIFSGSPIPGKIHHADSFRDLSFISKKQYSSHGLTLSDIYELGESLECIPHSIFVIGIEGVSWEIGSKMGEDISAVLPEVLRLVLHQLG